MKKAIFGKKYLYTEDVSAMAFVEAALINDPVQINAVNGLVIALKNSGIWEKSKAIYPFVGGNSFAHKFNLKDPRDLNEAFRLAFNGNILHDSNGIKGDNGFANTFIIPSIVFANHNVHGSIYSKTDISGAFIDFGCNSTTGYSPRIVMHPKWSDGNGYFDMTSSSSAGRVTIPSNSDSLGFFLMTRESFLSMSVYKNSALLGTSVGEDLSVMPNKSIFLMASNSYDGDLFASPRQLAFASFGHGLNTTESYLFNTIVSNFQSDLSRIN